MGAIAIAAVALSMTLVYHALDGRLNRLAVAHVDSSAARVAAIAADRYTAGGWSQRSLAELVERSRVAGFDITVTDLAREPARPARRASRSRASRRAPRSSRPGARWAGSSFDRSATTCSARRAARCTGS